MKVYGHLRREHSAAMAQKGDVWPNEAGERDCDAKGSDSVKTKTPFSPQNSLLRNAAIAFFDKLAKDPLTGRVFGYAVNWPRDTRALTDRLGNYAAIGTWKRKRRKPVVRAYIISPAVDAVLDILVPALCQRNPEPFRLFARQIEGGAPTKSTDSGGYPVRRLDRYPVHPVQYLALSLAYKSQAEARPESCRLRKPHSAAGWNGSTAKRLILDTSITLHQDSSGSGFAKTRRRGASAKERGQGIERLPNRTIAGS